MSSVEEPSLLFPLFPPKIAPTHEQALIADALKYGIGKDLDVHDDVHVGYGCYVTPDGLALKRPTGVQHDQVLDLSQPGTRPSSASHSPVPWVASQGGERKAGPFVPPGRRAVPLSAVDPPPVPDPAPGRGFPQVSLGKGKLNFELVPLSHRDIVDMDRGPVLYSMQFRLYSMKNFEVYHNTRGVKPEWEALKDDDEDEDDEGEPEDRLVRLAIDSAAGDSWTFGSDKNMTDYTRYKVNKAGSWKDLSFDYLALFARKAHFPEPPATVVPRSQATAVSYGVNGDYSHVVLLPSVCQLAAEKEGGLKKYPLYPIGVAIGSDSTMLWRIDDGILALGRGYDASSFFRDPAMRWKGQPFHFYLYKNGFINRPRFWVFIGHATYEPRLSLTNFIIFGRFRHPWMPDMTMANFKEITVANTKSTAPGKWLIWLEEVQFVAGDGRLGVNVPPPISVKEAFAVDTGASQSFFPQKPYEELNKLMTQLGAPAQGVAPTFHKDDKLIFKFKSQGQDEIREVSCTGQAKRFFVSPLRTDDNNQATTFGLATTHILGLNFLRTFFVGFEETNMRGQVYLAPQPSV